MPAPAFEAETNAARPPVDVSVLEDLVGDEPAVVHRFLAIFLTSSRDQALGIAAARAAGDSAGVGEIAHRLKSGSRSIGARALGDLCAELEIASRAGDDARIAASCGRFADEMRAVDAYLAHRLGER